MTARIEAAANWHLEFALKTADSTTLLTFIARIKAHGPLVLYFMGKPFLGATP